MKYLTKFETQAAYTAAESSLALPNVSLITETNGVAYKPSQPTPPTETRVVATFNVDDDGIGIGILSNDENISAIEIDGVEQPTVVIYYTFSTRGEHTVKYTLIDPTTISDSAFSSIDSLTSIDIPSSVTSIGNGAFGSCSSLTSITIPNSVTTIGDSAFQDCRSLTSITIPNGVTNIGEYTFSYCSGMTTCNIGSGVTTIGNNAFTGCYSLTSINIPSSVTSIGDYAFCQCNNIDDSIVETIYAINPLAFYCEN